AFAAKPTKAERALGAPSLFEASLERTSTLRCRRREHWSEEESGGDLTDRPVATGCRERLWRVDGDGNDDQRIRIAFAGLFVSDREAEGVDARNARAERLGIRNRERTGTDACRTAPLKTHPRRVP